jgi:rod shape-determining protein MreB
LKPRGFSGLRFFTSDLGIDLGSSRTQIARPGEGVVLDEPTLVVVDRATRRVFNRGQAVGNLARMMQGRTPDSVQLVNPIRLGAVADSELCGAMLRVFLAKLSSRRWARPRVLMAIPNGITPVERQALFASGTRAGIQHISLINKSLAAGIAAGLPIAEPAASMICDMGASVTEIAVLCLGGVTVSETLRVAGDDLGTAIRDYLRREHRLRIGQQESERVKLEIGAAVKLEPVKSVEVGGRDLLTGLPRRIELRSDEVCVAIEAHLRSMVAAVERVLESCPAEMAADLMENGMVLVGAGAQLRCIDQLLTDATGMPVRVAEEPATCAARGLAICLENLDVWQNMLQGRQVA